MQQGAARSGPESPLRRGARLRHTLVVGVVLVAAVLVALSVLSWSPLVAIPFVVAIAVAIGSAFRDLERAIDAEVTAIDGARQRALAEARTKAHFLANMSHEIRTPMNGILGMAELLVQSRLDADQEQMAATIQTSADALLIVLNDILDLSKIEAGKLELEAAELDLWQLVDECAGLMHKSASEKGIEILTYIDPRVGRCHRGDSVRVRQLVLNFLSNGVKFTLAGEVVLGVDLLADDNGAETVRVWVRDTGVGISQAAIPRLFVPFSQADGSTPRKFGGTGLGLVICRRLVELMGGSIDVQSRLGEGSTFSFTLRLPKGEAAAWQQRAEQVDLSGESVLLVDGHATNLKLMALQLAPTRIGIDLAGDGDAAIELLRRAAREQRPFTMAIVDVMTPGMDGLQLVNAIRADAGIPPLPVCIASSVAGRPGAEQLDDADVFRWLRKPLASGRLLEAVRDMARVRLAPGDRQTIARPRTAPRIAETDDGVPVLVAEDNEINRRVIAGMLRRLGCEPTFAMDGAEAVRIVQQRPFALVLMDCQMPEMDGYEATRAIRALGRSFGDLPIVALTANVLPADREACVAAGMNDFLGKPVKLDVLRSAIQRWAGVVGPEPAQRS
jgi:signal transduction histidine kinase/CheY-like chemotaxis protein